VGKLEITKLERTGASLEQAIKGRRAVDYATEGIHEATIYDGAKLEPDMSFAGPAVIEDPGTTVVIQPGNRVSVDDYGNIHIAIEG
jgi:N-methylhydantoinase A